jgi:vitamin B12 transporter
MRKIYVLNLLVVFIATTVEAQDSTKTTMLKEVVVSASRTEQRVIDAPRSISVIGERTISTSVYQSVGELLNAQSGMFVTGANQTPGTNQALFMRGANSNQVAVLIDGVRITDASSPNAAIDLSEISLTNVERIEILRGSHSTLYGGAAVGGVVNIITKKRMEKGVRGSASVQGALFNDDAWSMTETVDLAYGIGNGFYANASLFRQDANGLDATEKLAPSFTADRDGFKKTDGFVKAGYRKDQWDVSASFKNSFQYTEIDDGAYVDDENSYLEFDRKLIHYSVKRNLNSFLDVQLIGSFSDSERFYEDDSSQVAANAWDHYYSTGSYYGKIQTHELQLTYGRDRFHALAGVGLYREKMFFDSYFVSNDPMFPYESITNYDTLDTRTTTMYAFARADYHWGNFKLSAGTRVSHHTEAGAFATFDVNPSYTVNDFVFFGSLSSGFNPPSLYQLYDPVQSFGAFAPKGNPGLKPETSLSFEAGIKKQFRGGTFLTLSAYSTTVKDGIEYVYLWNGSKTVAELDFSDYRGDRYINIGEQLMKGVELEADVNLTNSVVFSGSISYVDTKVQASANDLKTEYTGGHYVQLYNLGHFLISETGKNDVVRRPAFTATSQFRWQIVPTVGVQAIYRYTGRRYDAVYNESLGPYGALSLNDVDAYHLVDLGIQWKASKAFAIAFKVENILDEEYREVLGFRTRGRSALLKLMVNF